MCWRRWRLPARARSTASTSIRPTTRGDKDWKYNNDYVDSDDAYRHSKWLAMMERRLIVARKLLNPERLRPNHHDRRRRALQLGLLVDQLFPAKIQMLTR